jgi:eukaryotic-like serine/threonine-protein kinase
MIDLLIADRYKIIKKIAVGGTSDIYIATDIKLNRQVAVKLLTRSDAGNRTFVAKFKKEAQILAKLSDPHIVSVYDWGEFEGSYYICMEYVKGQNLKEIIERKGIIDPKSAAIYAIQICKALEVAHQNNLIHRDIKPQNILITEDNKVKVTDFGIAKSLADDSTKTINIMGTANYISPEQAQGKILDISTDIYSLGIVIYEMLTSDLPFRGASSIDITLKHINEKPIAPSILVDHIPPDMEKIVMKCLEKDPEQRYKDAAELREDMQNFLYGRPLILAQKTLEKNIPKIKKIAALKPFLKKEKNKKGPVEKFSMTRTITLSITLLTAFAFIALFLIFFFRYNEQIALNQYVNVPPIENIDYEAAKNIIETLGLEIFIEDEIYSERMPKNYILSQSPGQETLVLKDSTINVILSLGIEQEMVRVPNLVGLELRRAREVITDSKFSVGIITYRNIENIAEGLVISHDPAFDTVLPEESAIHLRVSLGPAYIILPNIIGLDYMVASAQIESADLVILKKRVTNFEYQPGAVVRVDPIPGTRVGQNEVITLYIATTEEMKVVPDVTQISVENAIGILEGQEIQYEIAYVATEFAIQKGTVLKQDPVYLETISQGQKVILFVGN